MKNEILEDIKRNYYYEEGLIEQRIDDEIRISELQRNDLVKEYIQLIEKRNVKIDFSRDLMDIMYECFCKEKDRIKQTNEIYFYLGTYIDSKCSDVQDSSDIEVQKDDPMASYSLYVNIENEEYKQIKINERELFEKRHAIIFLKNTLFSKNEFYKIQKEFIRDCIKETQEYAVQKVLEKSNKVLK